MGWARKNVSGGSSDLVKRAATAAKNVKPSGKAPPTRSNKRRSYSFSKGKAASEKGTPEKAAPEKAAPKPAKRRRSSFGGGSSQPPRPAPQRSSAAPQTASRGPMAPMDAVRKSQQQSRSGGTPGGPSTTRRGGFSGYIGGPQRSPLAAVKNAAASSTRNPGGNSDMNRSSARGTGTPSDKRSSRPLPPQDPRLVELPNPTQRSGSFSSLLAKARAKNAAAKNAAAAPSGTGAPAPTSPPRTGLPDGFKPNMPIVGSPTPAPSTPYDSFKNAQFGPGFNGRHVIGGQAMRMKKGGEVKKGGKAKAAPSRGNGIAKRGLGKGRMR